MGIWGLQTLVNERQWYDVVNIKDIADEWRGKNRVEPVIAVDGPACARHLYGKADKICGGQYKQFREACRTFVRMFHDSGIRLVFFFDGVPMEEKTRKWVERKRAKLREISQLFADFHARPLWEMTKKYLFLIPEAVVPSARVIFGTELGCEVHVATRDCDWELAEYAIRNRCLAIISNDTDLLAHDGAPCLITLVHLNTDDGLKARRYDPDDIASKLGLGRGDMPVLATFVGNDVVTRPQLRTLHARLESRYGLGHVFENVTKFVREGPPGNVPALCADAFGSHPDHREGEVRASIDSYRHGVEATEEPPGGDSWSEVLRLAEQRHVAGKMPAVVYAVMKCRRFRIGEALEDLVGLHGNARPSGLVLRPMRARLYRVLLNEQGPEPAEMTELVPTGVDDIPETSVAAAPLPPDVPHPGLCALWQQEDAAVEEQRWQLFAWVTSLQARVAALRARVEKLRSLSPPQLAVPAAALWYLRHGCHPALLRQEEAATFAAVAVAMASGDASPGFLAGPPLESVDVRAASLAALFVRTVLHVLDAAAACSLSFPCQEACLPDAYFDGRYFHDVYAASVLQSSRNRRQYLNDPRYYLQWCALYEEQFQRLILAIESID